MENTKFEIEYCTEEMPDFLGHGKETVPNFLKRITKTFYQNYMLTESILSIPIRSDFRMAHRLLSVRISRSPASDQCQSTMKPEDK